MDRKAQLASNLARVRAEIAELAAAAGRPAPELLPVTKFHPAEDIALLGVDDVAENREQEARAKAAALPGVRFHMIGQVQTKKANHVARWAASVHSLDSVKLACALDRGVALALERGERDCDLPVFIQVSADGDTSRGGVPYAGLGELADAVRASEHLVLQGLMVVPPLGSDAAEVFAAARAATDRLGPGLKLSAGMSGDMAEAIKSGTDIVRVGTAIMGPRPLA